MNKERRTADKVACNFEDERKTKNESKNLKRYKF